MAVRVNKKYKNKKNHAVTIKTKQRKLINKKMW